ncbi:MAG: protein kinase [Planctomycetes bacterium]|nr:protein kinase [Planctomycetota bacterium]
MDHLTKDRDLGELAVRQQFLSREELDMAMEAQKLASPPRPLTEILLEMQLVTQTQLDRLLRIREKPTEQATAINDLFGRLAVQLEFATQEQVEEALAEQRVQEARGQRMRLGQIMLKKRFLTTEQFLEILKFQEKTVLTCPSCNARYLVGELGEPESGGVFRCLACSALLNVPGLTPPPVEAPSSPTVQAGDPEPAETRPPETRGPESAVETIRVPSTSHGGAKDPTVVTRASLPPEEEEEEKAKTFGRYEILEEVGRGPIAVVYRARDLQRRRTVALKVLESKESDSQAAQRFLREARVAAQLDHPGILEIYEVGSNEETPYFSMEYVDGRDLGRMMAERRGSRDEVVAILEKTCRALEYAHAQGITHRNLRPSNILVDGSRAPHVADFGVRPGLAPTTAPEQVRGQEDGIDARTDVYALGAILYEVLTGRPPFDAGAAEELPSAILRGAPERPADLSPDVPRELELVCLKAMDRDRALRYATAGEMADDLRRFLEGEPIQARPISVVTRVGVRMRRHLGLSVAVPLVVLLAAGGAVFGTGWWKRYRQRQERKAAEDRREKAQAPYAEGEKACKDAVEALVRERDGLRELRRSVGEIAQRLEDARWLLGKNHPEAARLLGEAGERYAAAAAKLASGTAEREETRKLLDEGQTKYAAAAKVWKRPPHEAERLIRECDSRYDDAIRLCGRVKAWPGEIRRSLEAGTAKLDEALAGDPGHPESLHVRAKIHQLLFRFDEADRDFLAAREAYARTIAWMEAPPTPSPDLDRLRQMSVTLRLDRGKFLFLLYELWVGRPLVLFGDRGEGLSFVATESAPAATAKKEMAGEFRAFLAAGRTETPENMLAATALMVAGEPPPGFKLHEADLYLRGDQGDGIGLRILSQAYRREKSWRNAAVYVHSALQMAGPLSDWSGAVYGLPVHPRPVLEWSDRAHSRALESTASPELLANRSVLRLILRRTEEARTDLEAALAARPGDAEMLTMKAALLLAAGEPAAAAPCLNQALASGTAPAEASALRAELLLWQGDPEAAFKEAEKALRARPEDPVFLYLLGRVQLARADASSVGASGRGASDIYRMFHQAFELRAAAMMESQDHHNARDYVADAIRLRPDYAPAYVTRARVRHRTGDLEGAESDLDRAMKLDPKSPLPWIWRGEFMRLAVWTKSRALFGRGLREGMREKGGPILLQALEAFAKASALDPNSAESVALQVLCKIETGRPQAGEDVEDLIRRFPKYAFGYEIRGSIYYQSQQFEKAAQDLTTAGDLQPARRSYYKDLADEARRRLEEQRNRPEWFKGFSRAQERIQQNQYAEALKEYRAAEPHLPKEVPTNPEERSLLMIGTYNYACTLAVESEKSPENRGALVEEAFKWLTVSCDLGFRGSGDRCHRFGAEHARNDEDFKALRGDRRFLRLLGFGED